MSNDQQTYKRAANAAMFGMIAQIFLAMVVVIIGLIYGSAAIDATIWYFLGGVPVWFILWALFNAHKQERVEALEAEQLAEVDAEAAALFNEAGQQLHVARKRLDNLYKYWLNGVSLALSLYLLTLGGFLLYKANGMVERIDGEAANWKDLVAASISPNANPLVLLFLLGAIAFLGFLTARYVAGMTKVKEWQPLRGGASYMIGNVAVVLLMLFAGTIPVLVNPEHKMGFVALSLIVPAIMVLLGLEIVLSYVFGMYRPRRTNEVVRPAFDSRVLGWLTRPESISKIIGETLNYQFGFEISRSWFMELLNKSMPKLVVIGLILLVLLSSLTIVEPQQQAVIMSYGKIDRIEGPGFHFKMPWPIGTSEKYDVDRIQRIVVGSSDTERKQASRRDPIKVMLEDINREMANRLAIYRFDHTPEVLWTNAHARGAEDYMVIAPKTNEDKNEDPGFHEAHGSSVAGELVGIEMVVDYRIKNLEQFVSTVERPDKMLKALAVERLSDYIAGKDIDMLVGEGRAFGANELKGLIQDDVDDVIVDGHVGLGIEVVFVGFASIHPPQDGDVAKAFHEQNGAHQDKQIVIQNAQKDAIQTLSEVAGTQGKALAISAAIDQLETIKLSRGDEGLAEKQAEIEALMDRAGGRAAQMLQEARAYRWDRALEEQAASRSFDAQLAAFKNAPEYYAQRMLLNAMTDGLKERKKIVVSSDLMRDVIIRMDLKDSGSFMKSLFSTE
ncbi:FtsH protease regulator HflK [Poriferisphaera corsica]|uniref:FtsH protease regulator HflK n=1 Tax=Poriferisphaera corsica TaxID=2528020 RepID=A0A517YYM2_9BACT|nr:SPFH domain-containing protein [Poriferisphaera corsica]QDU35307.1 FtsH protease regulator HflK [Poriferisphaera corsica]